MAILTDNFGRQTTVMEPQPYYGTEVFISDRSVALHHYVIICGQCGIASQHHPVKSEFMTCNRKPVDFPYHYEDPDLGHHSITDYYLNPDNGSVFLATDLRGNGSLLDNYDRNTEDDYVSSDTELQKLDRWLDVTHDDYNETWVGTVTPEQYATGYSESLVHKDGSVSPFTELPEPSDVNAYVEGHEGFVARKYLDDILTRRYHARLLNVFKDKNNGDLRIGGIRIVKCADNTIEARCVQNSCRNSMFIRLEQATREDYETFVLAIIRHGNNHAAEWFRNRPTYYKVHAINCDLAKCDNTQPFCQHVLIPSEKGPEEDNTVQLLLEHNSICTNKTCKCETVLKSMVPALT